MIELVVIGDSLSQGFQSGAIHNTHLSYPSLLAHAMGLGHNFFRVPDFSGKGGLPLNIEDLLRRLADSYGEKINFLEFVPAIATGRGMMDEAEDYWERGPGSRASDTGPLHHNLAVWGFEIGDADTLSEAICRQNIPTPSDEFFSQIPERAMYRTARRTLNPAFSGPLEDLTQVGVAQQLATEGGGIRNLILWLGGNNCLGTVTDLEIRWSEDADLNRLAHERKSNLWRPEHFATAYRRVADKTIAVNAEHVFVGTIPHVTIPPVSRGISVRNPERDEAGYYEYYTHFWVWDADFKKNPGQYHHLTREEARLIDQTIDAYNDTIRQEAQDRGWQVIELANVLDALAFRRQGGNTRYQFPTKFIQALQQDNDLAYLVSGDPPQVNLDTRYLRVDPNNAGQIRAGGIFSLDGVHPTTLGYGIVAYEVLQVMRNAWGSQGSADQPPPGWWDNIITHDRLVREPPENLRSLRELLGFLSGRGFFRDLFKVLGGNILR